MLLHVAAALVLAVAGTAPTVEFRWQDPRITESSGLVVASSGDLVYTHNDSGDEGRVFAVGLDGVTRTTYVLPGVEPRDWEDIALGPDEQGRSSLWIGDIGDNSAARDNGLLVHRVLEPVPTESDEVTTEAPTSFRLRYRDGPVDAETLLVHPRTGRLFIVSKPLAGAAGVYAAPPTLDPDGPNVLEQVAEVRAQATGTAGGPRIGGLANLLVTGGDIAPDGSRVALRTYTDLYEWTVTGDDVASAFGGEPTVTPLPPTEQGEGLAYAADGRSLLTSTEGAGSEVHRVLPGEPAPTSPPESAAPAPTSAPDPEQRLPLVPAAGALALALGLALLVARARSRAFRRSAPRKRAGPPAHRRGESPPAHRRDDGRRRSRG